MKRSLLTSSKPRREGSLQSEKGSAFDARFEAIDAKDFQFEPFLFFFSKISNAILRLRSPSRNETGALF